MSKLSLCLPLPQRQEAVNTDGPPTLSPAPPHLGSEQKRKAFRGIENLLYFLGFYFFFPLWLPK